MSQRLTIEKGGTRTNNHAKEKRISGTLFNDQKCSTQLLPVGSSFNQNSINDHVSNLIEAAIPKITNAVISAITANGFSGPDFENSNNLLPSSKCKNSNTEIQNTSITITNKKDNISKESIPSADLQTDQTNRFRPTENGTMFIPSASSVDVRKGRKCPLSNAERCRRYRQKRKESDPKFAEKEKERQRDIRKRKTVEQNEMEREASRKRMRIIRRKRREDITKLGSPFDMANESDVDVKHNKEQKKKMRKTLKKGKRDRKTHGRKNQDSSHKNQHKNMTEKPSQISTDSINNKDEAVVVTIDDIDQFGPSNSTNAEVSTHKERNNKEHRESSRECQYTGECNSVIDDQDTNIEERLELPFTNTNSVGSISTHLDITLLKRYSQYLNPVIRMEKIKETMYLSSQMSVDETSKSIMPELHMNEKLYPVQITADGNCLPRCGSLLAFGTEDRHEEIRERIVLEMIINEEHYLSLNHIVRDNEMAENIVKAFTMYSKHYSGGTAIDKDMIKEIYNKEIKDIMTLNTFMGVWQICALSTVLNSPIFSVYPEKTSQYVRDHLHRKIYPVKNGNSPFGSIYFIMWTRTSGKNRNWELNHFVPLLPKAKDTLSGTDILDAVAAVSLPEELPNTSGDLSHLTKEDANTSVKFKERIIFPQKHKDPNKISIDSKITTPSPMAQAYDVVAKSPRFLKILSQGVNSEMNEIGMVPHSKNKGIEMNDETIFQQTDSYSQQSETMKQNQLKEFQREPRYPQLGHLLPNGESVEIPREVLTSSITEDRMKYSRNNRNETCTASLVSSFSIKRNLPAGAVINSCCIIPGRRLLLTDFICSCIYICGIDGTDDNSINVDYNPLCVTLYDKNKALVSARSKVIAVINLTSLETDRMIKVKRFCLRITSIDDKICVTTDNRTLTMIDINGNVLKEINISFYPLEICINKAGYIYCTTEDDDIVYVVTSEREERQIYSSPDLRYAIGLITDNNGDVYVGGRKSNNIHKISSDGKRHRIILTKNDGIKSPRELSYNKETNELMVLCGGAFSNGQSINVYKVK